MTFASAVPQEVLDGTLDAEGSAPTRHPGYQPASLLAASALAPRPQPHSLRELQRLKRSYQIHRSVIKKKLQD